MENRKISALAANSNSNSLFSVYPTQKGGSSPQDIEHINVSNQLCQYMLQHIIEQIYSLK
jgi:hypothetical protein